MLIADCVRNELGLWVARVWDHSDDPPPFNWEHRGATVEDALAQVLGRPLEVWEHVPITPGKDDEIDRFTFILPPEPTTDAMSDLAWEMVEGWDTKSLMNCVVDMFYDQMKQDDESYAEYYRQQYEYELDDLDLDWE